MNNPRITLEHAQMSNLGVPCQLHFFVAPKGLTAPKGYYAIAKKGVSVRPSVRPCVRVSVTPRGCTNFNARSLKLCQNVP